MKVDKQGFQVTKTTPRDLCCLLKLDSLNVEQANPLKAKFEQDLRLCEAPERMRTGPGNLRPICEVPFKTGERNRLLAWPS